MANPLYGQNKFDGTVDNTTGSIVHFAPTADGTHIADAESIVLAAADSGNKYFVNISTYTCSVRLPSCASSNGYEVSFYLDITSDGETSKDLDIFTDATTEFIIGACVAGGVVYDSAADNDLLRIDTSAGTAGAGDRVSLICDGLHWYVAEANTLTGSAFVSGTATRA